jgi:hypothetical protein
MEPERQDFLQYAVPQNLRAHSFHPKEMSGLIQYDEILPGYLP